MLIKKVLSEPVGVFLAADTTGTTVVVPNCFLNEFGLNFPTFLAEAKDNTATKVTRENMIG